MHPDILLGKRLSRLHDAMAAHVARGTVPGVVVLLSQHGDVHVDLFGAKAVGGRERMARDTIFRISSMTKPIIAVATMQLIEDGTLQLDEPVDRLLPELANRRVLRRIDGALEDTVPAHRAITVRDLLTFRLGFGLIFAETEGYPIFQAANDLQIGMGPPSPATMPAPDEWLRRLGTLPLMYQPGERWLYNTGSDILGVLIARAAGQPLESLLRERIFVPLGMEDTSFSVPPSKRDRFVPSYSPDETGALAVYDPAEGSQWSSPPAFMSGAGGLVSTVNDMLAFGQLLLNKGQNGDTRLLSANSIELMTTDQLTPTQREEAGGFLDGDRGWGFGLAIIGASHDGTTHPGRFGWEGGLGTSWASDPAEDLVAILMTQVMGFHGGIYDDFWQAIYGTSDD